ncbi:MAG: DUF3576 domain-containing protein [Alphaproteobacteria bacterium]|nr:DUF3576 domain-containing protein [Alphaproteobacteria bacterium]
MTTKYLAIACAVLILSGCGSSDAEKPKPTVEAPPAAKQAESKDGGVFDWFKASEGKASTDKREGGVAVNAYLWRASLDTLSFMPMDQADPFGGTIKTGWYTPAATPNERLRVAVYVLDARLRADALRVSVFKEAKKPTGEWIDATVDPETVTKLENLILNKARALKIQAGD